jgi:hypothetical protein
MVGAAPLSTAALVRWTLEHAELVALVQGLDAAGLERLVEHVGFEDLAELLELPAAEQLERMFDEELWRSAGDDPGVDAARFALWLEILLQVGNEVAVEKIASMDEESLALGLSRHVLVFEAGSEHDALDPALESCLYARFEPFRIVAREAPPWQTLSSVMQSLDRQHPAFLRRILERCCAVTSSHVADDGELYDLLTSEEMRAANVAAKWQERQRRPGLPLATAASFLRLARGRTLAEVLAARGHDAVTRTHFEAVAASTQTPSIPPPASSVAATIEEFFRESASTERHASFVERGMRALRAEAADVYHERFRELTYLVNVLLAVSQDADEPPRRIEAIDTATRVCDLGIARLVEASGLNKADEDRMLAFVVRKQGLVKAFRVGWNLVGDERWTALGLRDLGARASRLVAESE